MDGFTIVFGVKAIGFTIFLFLFFHAFGSIIRIYFRKEDHNPTFIDGFVYFLGIFQVAVTPILFFHLSFDYALVIFVVIVVLVSVIFIFHRAKQPQFRLPVLPDIRPDRLVSISLAICVTIILLQSVGSSLLNFQNSDDSFYIGLAEKSIDNPSLYLSDPSTSDPRFPLMSQYRFESWELLMSTLSKLSGLKAAELAHTVFPFTLILLSYLSYASLAKHFCPKRFLPLFLIVLSLFHLFGGYSQYSQGSFLLTRIWQGKAVLLHILIPYLISTILTSVKNPSVFAFIQLTAISFAGIALNPIAVYMIPIPLVGLIGIDFIQNKCRNKRTLLLIGGIVPLALFAIAIRVGISNSQVFNNPDDLLQFDPQQIALRFMGLGIFWFAAYMVMLIVLFATKDKTIRLLFVYFPLLLVLTIWNPFFAPYIAKYITSFATYWRVYWFLLIGPGISITVVYLVQSKRWKLLVALTGFLIMSLFAMGKAFLYGDPLLYHPQSTYKISQNHLAAVDYLIQEQPYPTLILAPEELAISVPQLTTSVRLFWSKSDYIQDFLYRENQRREFNRRLHLEMIYNPGNEMPPETIRSEVDAFNIDLVVVPSTNSELIQKVETANMKQVYQTPGYLYYSLNAVE